MPATPHSSLLSLLVFVEDDRVSPDGPFHVHTARTVASLGVNRNQDHE